MNATESQIVSALINGSAYQVADKSQAKRINAVALFAGECANCDAPIAKGDMVMLWENKDGEKQAMYGIACKKFHTFFRRKATTTAAAAAPVAAAIAPAPVVTPTPAPRAPRAPRNSTEIDALKDQINALMAELAEARKQPVMAGAAEFADSPDHIKAILDAASENPRISGITVAYATFTR